MVEPISAMLLTKGATIAIDQIVSHLMASADATLPILRRIEADVSILRNAFVEDALDCLREGDISAYKKAAREAKNRNKLNPYPRFMYVDALCREQNYSAASEAIWECVQWYGPYCPLLPNEVREVLLQDGALDLLAGAPLTNTFESPYGMPGWRFQGVGVCAMGYVAAWQHNYGILNLTVGTLLTYRPWSIAGDAVAIELFADDGSNERPIYWLTERILVHPFGNSGKLQAVDLANPSDRVELTTAQARNIFGAMAETTWLSTTGQLRGVSVEISERHVTIPRNGSMWLPQNDSGDVTDVTLTPRVAIS